MTDASPERPPSNSFHLPEVAAVTMGAPLKWLSRGWRDLMAAPGPCLIYGIAFAAIGAMVAWALFFSGAFAWMLILAGGFLLIGPMVAMGLYEAARKLEAGEKPTLADMAFVKGAFRRDLAYLGLALFLIYLLWTRLAQIVYALSTYTLHKTPQEFLTFMVTTPEGQQMAVIGTVVGGVIAFLAYMLVVISAPMLLDQKRDVFIATITSVRAVTHNPAPMLLWALIIVAVMTLGVATGFVGLVIAFPLIGLASWHAYRDLVPGVIANSSK